MERTFVTRGSATTIAGLKTACAASKAARCSRCRQLLHRNARDLESRQSRCGEAPDSVAATCSRSGKCYFASEANRGRRSRLHVPISARLERIRSLLAALTDHRPTAAAAPPLPSDRRGASPTRLRGSTGSVVGARGCDDRLDHRVIRPVVPFSSNDSGLGRADACAPARRRQHPYAYPSRFGRPYKRSSMALVSPSRLRMALSPHYHVTRLDGVPRTKFSMLAMS